MYSDEHRGLDFITFGGLLVTILLHGGAIGGIFLYRQQLGTAAPPPPPDSYVVAKLVRLGKPREPKSLPNKIIPQPETAIEETIDLTADAHDAPSKPKDKPDRDSKLSDKIRHSLDKADLLANAQADIEQEGSPDGVASGTATEASQGDPYITKIADLFRRSWALPAIIPRDEAKRLFVLFVLRIDAGGTIQTPIQLDRSSGNMHFDNSVVAAWQHIRRLPQPPPDRFASILANGLPLKITWRGLE